MLNSGLHALMLLYLKKKVSVYQKKKISEILLQIASCLNIYHAHNMPLALCVQCSEKDRHEICSGYSRSKKDQF